MAHSSKSAAFLVETRIRDAIAGDVRALYELGVAYSTGSGGTPVDLIEAHKWFNIAAARGDLVAARHREEVASEMTREEIAAALRAAREWISRLH